MTDTVSDFINAACVPLSDHPSGSLDAAEAILAAHPEVATSPMRQGDAVAALNMSI